MQPLRDSLIQWGGNYGPKTTHLPEAVALGHP
jgi:hypothetical protein